MGPYAYIAIEGNIGAGKTTFTELVAKQYGYELILERFEENPFLERFYEDTKSHAFSVELAFVADRFKQLREALGSRNLFRQQVLADYSFAKSLIFAKANLPQSEFILFRTMFRLMEAQLPKPEVIAILNPGIEKVKNQIIERGRSYEQDMPEGYLERVWSGYEEHYKFHRGSRVLWIDTSDLDFVKNNEDFKKLLTCILAPRKPGVYHLKP
ncbi:MAG: deoxynucleoside kinase [Crocinitomicaceae bacterium]|nr:deoxynucleoside kinase [Crocinitomicaceae bacterium]|tara:strand:+ start:244 stop:879 length:636 start_codon:yes stop_codon:yes gene_type:complete